MLDDTPADLAAATAELKTNLKGTSSQGLLLQGYANMISSQTNVDLSGFDNLKKFDTDINGAINSAKSHANTYLTVIQPKMVETTTNIDGFINIQTALSSALQPNTSVQEATQLIGAAADQSSQYQADASSISTLLGTLNVNLNTDSGNFKTFVTDMNAAVSGDNGVLESIDDQIGTLDKEIAGAAAGIAIGGLAVFGGGLMIATGAIAELFTAGTSTALVVAGVGVAAVGVAGVTAGGIVLANALDAKGDLISKKAKLKTEVAYALSLKSNFHQIALGSASAAKAAGEMANAWGTMNGHLVNLIKDLEKGKISVDGMRKLMLYAAQGDLKNLQTDNGIIQQQLAGVSVQNDVASVPQVIRTAMGIAA
jgi:hypothetical protein